MKPARFDVTGIGNAIVDVIAHANEAFLVDHQLTKGAMRLIDSAEARSLYEKMGQAVEISGGSAGNTMAGLASLGGKGAYVGKVADDQLGDVFAHDIQAAGVHFETRKLAGGAPTARCLILVTPDAQRTMNTFLGACVELGPEDIEPSLIAESQVVYLEGYLYDPPRAKAAFLKAAKLAHEAGRKVALSLSDPFCVDRHRDEFMNLVRDHVDILFANQSEITSLYRTNTFEEAVQLTKGLVETAALTQSEQGSLVLHKGEVVRIAAAKVEQVVDTTGAGDLYAAGFLYGYTRGLGAEASGRIGAIAAAEVISHVGARPAVPLVGLLP